ncbi:acyl carrier protein [Streptomyces millisiae]|uniref:Acyl carrier protein n=1 Tax=Streptomyces millisiae TaxID=3075542 RepID=A0ABU2LHW7_9ACTN|nr:acyl carrier protein [Streptomyces sp. DSM 44918]MDT0317184.1 acyl carrier protein [Streptomyces sp. DSM 44918]
MDAALTPWQVQDWLTARVAELLRVDVAQVSSEAMFRDLGLSSVQLVEMTADLEDWSGRPLPATFVFDCPTIEDAVAHLTRPATPEPAVGRDAVAAGGTREGEGG